MKKSCPHGGFRTSLTLLAAFAAFPFAPSLFATTRTFDGSTSGDIEIPGNYDASVVPANSLTTDVLSVDATVANNPYLSMSRSLLGFTFAGTTGGFSLTSANNGGSPYALSIGTTGFVSSNTAGINTIGSTTAGTNAGIILGGAAASQTVVNQAAGGTLLIDSPISSTNAAGLNFSGAAGSVVILAGSNTFSGASTLGAGTLDINNATALGTGGALTLSTAGGTIDNTSGSAVAVTGSVILTANSGNSFNFSTSSGTTANDLTFNGSLSYSGPRTFTLNGAGSLTFAGGLTETNTAGYALTVNNGTGTASTTNLTVGGIMLGNANGTAARTIEFAGTGSVVVNGAVVDGNSFSNVLEDASIVTLSGNNTFSGGVLLAGTPTLNLNSVTALGTGPLTLVSGATIDNTSGAANVMTTTNAIALNSFIFSTSAGTSANNLTFGSGLISATTGRTITLNGGGALTFGGVLANASGTNASETFTVNDGTNTTSNSSASFGGFQLSTAAATAAVTSAFNGTGNVIITGAVTNGGSGANGLTYSGTGTLTLAGVNTNTGATTISSGKLASGNNTTSTIGGALMLTSTSTLAGTLSPGNDGGTGTTSIGKLNVIGALTLGTTATAVRSSVVFELGGTAAGTQYDQVSVAGGVTINNATATVSLINGYVPVNGDVLYLILNGSSNATTGTFATINGTVATQGADVSVGGYEFAVNYTANGDGGTIGNDVSLTEIGTPVPEPCTWVSLIVAAAVLSLLKFCRRAV